VRYRYKAFLLNRRVAHWELEFRTEAFQQGIRGFYDLMSSLSPAYFIFDRGFSIGAGENLVGMEVDRKRVVTEVAVYLVLVKGLTWTQQRIPAYGRGISGTSIAAGQREAALTAANEINAVLEEMGVKTRVAPPPPASAPVAEGAMSPQHRVQAQQHRAGAQATAVATGCEARSDRTATAGAAAARTWATIPP
jgi:hypothetical protein